MIMANLHVGSLNVCGLNNRIKRKKLFRQIQVRKMDIFFLQETYSTDETVRTWATEWGGKIYYSHGVSNARGVAILIGNRFVGEVLEVIRDTEGQFLILKCKIDDMLFGIMNGYAPNQDKPEFFECLFNKVSSMNFVNCIIGGDLNLVLDIEKDAKECKTNNYKSQKVVNCFLENEQMCDAFRTIFPNAQRYMHFKRSPFCAARLDMFLMSMNLVGSIEKYEIEALGYSDHSVVVMVINMDQFEKGPGNWHLNV